MPKNIHVTYTCDRCGTRLNPLESTTIILVDILNNYYFCNDSCKYNWDGYEDYAAKWELPQSDLVEYDLDDRE